MISLVEYNFIHITVAAQHALVTHWLYKVVCTYLLPYNKRRYQQKGNEKWIQVKRSNQEHSVNSFHLLSYKGIQTFQVKSLCSILCPFQSIWKKWNDGYAMLHTVYLKENSQMVLWTAKERTLVEGKINTYTIHMWSNSWYLCI